MRKILVFLSLLMLSGVAMAKPQELRWNWPTTSCDSEVLLVGDLLSGVIVVSTSPMPMPSDSGGACADPVDPDAPSSADLYDVPMPETSIILNLQPGPIYYARIRVCAYEVANCSNWSAEIAFQVPYGKPGLPIWIN